MTYPRRRGEKTIIELRGGFHPPPEPAGWDLQRPPQGLESVFALEPPQGRWSEGGTYGRQAKIAIPATAGVLVPVFSNDALDGFPRSRCINLYRSDQENNAHTGNNGFRLLCTYGLSGVQNQFLADWTQGGNFSLVCSTLRIEALSYAPDAEIPYSEPGDIVTLGAMVGLDGMTTPRDPLTYTTERVLLAAGESVTAVVPDFARRVIPQIDLGALTYTSVEFAMLPFGPRWDVPEFLPEIARDGVPLRGETKRVFLENNGGSSILVSFLFQLGI